MRDNVTARVCGVATTVAACGGTSSLAQTPTFAYQIEAPAVLAPGATTTITVLCGFTPGVGQLVQTTLGPFPVMGLESGGFSIAGSGGAWSNLERLPPFNFVLGPPPGTVAGSNVNGVIWGTGWAVPSTVNATPVWRATFTMPAMSVSLTLTGNGDHFMWAQHPTLPVTTNGVPAAGAQVMILVPAPGGAVGVALGVLLVRPRRAGVRSGRSEA